MNRAEVTAVYTHPDIQGEAQRLGIPVERMAATLVRHWQTLRTSGSKLKALRHTPGNDYRLRMDNVRVVFTVVQDSAYIHLAGRRDSIYESEQFRNRLDDFDRTCCPNGSWCVDRASQLGYRKSVFTLDVARSAASIAYELRPKQRVFFSRVLPLERLGRGASPRLTIGHGPPGSGKTVVALDLAGEAVAEGLTVDVLVPSDQLLHHYTERLRAEGEERLVVRHTNAAGIRVHRFESWFADRAGLDVPFDREAQVLTVFRQMLGSSRARAQRHRRRMPAGQEDRLFERLPVLADTLLLDDTWWQRYPDWRRQSKDSMVGAAAQYLDTLLELRDALIDSFDTGGSNALKTRSELAQVAASPSWQPARVTIVDEAQDLAPAEWRTLLASLLKANGDTHVVLLGDMRQRVSFVPFSWADVKTHATSVCGITSKEVAEMEVDNASYRMTRAVALAALSVFDKRVRGPDGSRRQGTSIDLERLAAGGKVRVAVVDEPGAVLFESEVRAWTKRNGYEPSEHLFCVHGRKAGTPFNRLPRLFNHSVAEAKGLESPGVVVNLPFGLRKDEQNVSIDHDDATEFYTAVSRAREKLLLVIDRASWSLLSQGQEYWQDAEIRVGTQITASWLREAIVDTSVGLSPSEVVAYRLSQLESAATSPHLDTDEVVTRVEEGLGALALEGGADIAEELPRLGAMLAAAQSLAFEQLRASFLAGTGDSSSARDVIYLLFFGEFAEAARAVVRLEESDAGVRWDAELIGMMASDSPIQAWLLAWQLQV